jgi:hypothetical protein
LNHITVNFDLAFAKRAKIGNSAKRSSDQTLDFERAATLFAASRFTVDAAMG